MINFKYAEVAITIKQDNFITVEFFGLGFFGGFLGFFWLFFFYFKNRRC